MRPLPANECACGRARGRIRAAQKLRGRWTTPLPPPTLPTLTPSVPLPPHTSKYNIQ